MQVVILEMDKKSLKIEIELVPKTSWWSNARSEFENWWYKIRKEVYRNFDYRCGICGGTGPKWPVETHEVWEYYPNSSIQRLSNVVSRCPSCHLVHHIGFAKTKGKYEESKSRFMNINNLSEQEAGKYISRAFNEWRKRNDIDWELDLSFLEEKYGYLKK